MEYKIESDDNEVKIEVTETRGKQKKLLQAFQKCQQGRCSCPTEEYSKLDTLQIETDEDGIRLTLKSKPHEKFDDAEIGKCLEYTRGKVMDEG